MANSTGQVPCSYHPNVMTGLRCSKCGRPICPRDALRTQVGWRCPDCAGVRAVGAAHSQPSSLLMAGVLALGVAVLVAALWRFIPNWSFYLTLAMGFGVVETIARFTGNRRGIDLQILSAVIITIGLALSRYFLADRYGIAWEQVNQFGTYVQRALQLRAIPDLFYVLIAYAIAWVRFR